MQTEQLLRHWKHRIMKLLVHQRTQLLFIWQHKRHNNFCCKCSLWSSVRAFNSRYLANKYYFFIELTQNILLSVMNGRWWCKVWYLSYFRGVWYLSGGSLYSASSWTWTCLWTSRTRLNTEGLKDRQEQGNSKPHHFPTMKNNVCNSVQFLNDIKSSVITNVLKRLRQWISSCEWQLKKFIHPTDKLLHSNYRKLPGYIHGNSGSLGDRSFLIC